LEVTGCVLSKRCSTKAMAKTRARVMSLMVIAVRLEVGGRQENSLRTVR
jgi:hypothetical protein